MRGAGVRVLIVGAGIAGCAAARTLQRWGAAVEIVERRRGPDTDGAGIYLPGNAVRALDVLALGREARERAVHIRRQRTADRHGRVLFDVDVDRLWRDVGPCLALSRQALHDVLRAGPDAVPVRWGRHPEVISTDRGGVAVTLADGSTARYDLVVGADGVHSSVRRQMPGGLGATRPVGQHAHRFLAPAGAFGGRNVAEWSVLLGPRTAFLSIPLGDGQIYCYCDGPPADPPPPLSQLLSGYAEPVPSVLDGLATTGATIHTGPVEEVVLATWTRGRILLIGDAAHATSPNMAQGAAMAVEDAIVLAESLATASSIPAALAAYEKRRRPRTDWVRAQTHRRDRARALRPALRNTTLTLLGKQIMRSNYRPLLSPP